MAVESVTVVAPQVQVGPFALSNGNQEEPRGINTAPKYNEDYCTACVTWWRLIYVCSSPGLVEQINNFRTLSLKDLTASDSDPFLTVRDDYFYHTQQPQRPEVSERLDDNIWQILFAYYFLYVYFFVHFGRSEMSAWDSPSRDSVVKLWVLNMWTRQNEK